MDPRDFDILSFDCYGTLIDWERGITAALRPVLEAHGVALTDEALLERYGRIESAVQREGFRRYREVLHEVVARLGAEMGFDPTEAETGIVADSLPEWRPFSDTVDALKALASRFDLAVISNVDDDLFEGSRRHLGVAFAHVVTAEQVGAYKPDPENFRVARERMGAPPRRHLHVAQSLFHDIAPARALGIPCVWVNRRAGSAGGGATPPAEATPDLEVPDLATLARLATSA